jgi:hypothetical protein
LSPTVATGHFEAGLQHQAAKIKIKLALAKFSVGKYVTGDCSKQSNLHTQGIFSPILVQNRYLNSL